MIAEYVKMKTMSQFLGRSILMLGLIGLAAVPAQAIEKQLRLDNGVLRVGMDLARSGGAITYLSLSGQDRNLINNFDRGRQVQQSYYAGQALDRKAQGQSPNWSPWPWNPIQVGDAYGNSAHVQAAQVKDGVAYVKTVPLLWDMKNEPAECAMEQWVNLTSNTLHVRNRLTIHRTDKRWTEVAPRDQELPAVYTIGDLPHLFTYIGDQPFKNRPLTEIVNDPSKPWPWSRWETPEHWAASVDDRGWGVGVVNHNCTVFAGGFVGDRKHGGKTSDSQTGYIAPMRQEALGKDATYEYEYDMIVGRWPRSAASPTTIRQNRPPAPARQLPSDRLIL